MNKLNLTDCNLLPGQVKRITSNGGSTLNYVELLFSDRVKVQFAPKEHLLQFTLSDTNLNMSDLNCALDKDTLRDLIVSLKDAYNQLLSSEVNNEN